MNEMKCKVIYDVELIMRPEVTVELTKEELDDGDVRDKLVGNINSIVKALETCNKLFDNPKDWFSVDEWNVNIDKVFYKDKWINYNEYQNK